MSAPPEISADTESAPPPRPAAPVLVRVDAQESQTIQTIRLHRALTIVGAKAHAHLRIISTEISGTHALLLNLGNNLFLRDLMSRTHTYVNDQKVSECRLKYGDVIRFGQMQFRFLDLNVLRQSLSSARSAPAELHRDGQITPLHDRSPVFVIGRQRGADLRLTSGPLSKVHAVLYEHAGKHVLRDLSRHGTFVDGQRIRRLELQGNEVIDIGGTQFRYQSHRSGPPVIAVAAAAPQSKVPPAESSPAPPPAAELAEDEAEVAGEQYVFAPEPEILSDRLSPDADDSAPRDTFESVDDLAAPMDDAPAEGTWELSAQDSANSSAIKLQLERADTGTEHAESAGDLLTWGFAVERDITAPAIPQASMNSADSSASTVGAADPARDKDPIAQLSAEPEAFPPPRHADVAPFDGAQSPSQSRTASRKTRDGDGAPTETDAFLLTAVDLETLTHSKPTAGKTPAASSSSSHQTLEADAPAAELDIPHHPDTATEEVPAPAPKRAKSKSQSPPNEAPVAPQAKPDPRRKPRKLQSLDGLLGDEVLTFGPSTDVATIEPQQPAGSPSRRILFIAIALIVLIALAGGGGAWWYLHGRF